MKFVLPVVSILLLLAVVSGAAFYFGQKSTVGLQINPTPTIGATQNTNPASQIQQTAQTTPVVQTKSVEAGGVLSFSKYTLDTPSDWAAQRTQGQDNDKLTLTKNGYSLEIYEAAFGGGGCLYPGDAPSEFAQTFSSFVEIQNANGFVFRRSPVAASGKTAWTVCQKNTSDGSFGAPTQFGGISISGPVTANESLLAEIDSILTSLKKE